MSSVINENQKREEKVVSQEVTYDRLSLGVDIGTSHCEVIVFGKNHDDQDEEKYHYSKEPLDIRCISSLILFAKDNESSISFVQRFQKNHSLPHQEEYLDGKKIPFVFYEQVEELIQSNNVTPDELDILKRSTDTAYPVKHKTDGSEYSELEKAVIRLNIERSLKPYLDQVIPLDIAFAKPCEAGKAYDNMLQSFAAITSNLNMTNDNRFFIGSEAIFTGHYLLNMLEGSYAKLGICDVGAGTGDVYMFDQDDSKTKVMKTFNFAGNQLTKELVKTLHEYAKVDISERDANTLKEQHGFINGFHAPEVIKPIIADLYVQGKPRKIRAGKAIDAAARPLAKEAVETIIKVFQEYDGLPPRVVALTGYQGQMEGLDRAIEEGLKEQDYDVSVKNLKAFNVNDPRSLVAKGAEDYSRRIRNQNWVIL